MIDRLNHKDAVAGGTSFHDFISEVCGLVIWNYAEEGSSVNDLYELAKKKFWNASEYIDWQETDRREGWPTRLESNPLFGFEPFDRLRDPEKVRVSWMYHGLEISEILHGEQGALIVASQLVSSMPTVEAKLFASSQVADEARHVEFFSRYLREVVGKIEPPSKALENLIKKMVACSGWDEKFIFCQILIESLAMAKFQELKQRGLHPILLHALDNIAKDEARHVKFGITLLRDHLSGLRAHELQQRSDLVLDHVIGLASAQNLYTRLAQRLGWCENSLRLHLRKYRIAHPEVNRNRFRQLSINMEAVGLVTEKSRERLAHLDVV